MGCLARRKQERPGRLTLRADHLQSTYALAPQPQDEQYTATMSFVWSLHATWKTA
jgi:hypothetical protein